MSKTLQEQLAEAQAAIEWMYDPRELEAEKRRGEVRARLDQLREAGPNIRDEDYEMLAREREEITHAMKLVRFWYMRAVAPPPHATPQRRMLVLLGGKAIGKTVAASWVFTQHRGKAIASEELQRMWNSHRPEHLAEMAAIDRAKVVLLDEVGAESDQARTKAAVLSFIDRRQHGGKLTILTGNLTKAAFASWLDERAHSRLVQIGSVWMAEGEDLRARAALREKAAAP